MCPDTSKWDRRISFDDAIQAIFSASCTLLCCERGCPACQKIRDLRPNYNGLLFTSLSATLLLNRLDAQGVEVQYVDADAPLTFNRAENQSVLVSDLDYRIHLTSQDGHTVRVSLLRLSDLTVRDALKHPVTFVEMCQNAGLPRYTPET